MHAKQSVDGLHFYNNTVFDNQVDPVTHIQRDSLVDDRNRLLCSPAKPSRRELVLKAGGVHGFEEPWTKSTMGLDSAAEDFFGE